MRSDRAAPDPLTPHDNDTGPGVGHIAQLPPSPATTRSNDTAGGHPNVDVVPHAVGQDAMPAHMTGFEDVIISWTMPWPQLVLIALVVASLRAWRVHRRRSAARLEARIEAEVSARASARDGQASPSADEVREPV